MYATKQMKNTMNKEVVYSINKNILLYQRESEFGVEYALFNTDTKKKEASGLIPWIVLSEKPDKNRMVCARNCITDDLKIRIQSIRTVSILMLESFKDSGVHARKLWKPDTLPAQDIRFINSRFQDLFMLPNNHYIQVDYPEETIIKRCVFIDPYHTQIGSRIFHICEFAECMERMEATYQPEPEITGEEAAWMLDRDKYLTIQVCDSGYEYNLLNKYFVDLDGGILENPELSILEARAEILQILGFSPKELRVKVYDEVMEQCFEAGRAAVESNPPVSNQWTTRN